LLKNLHQLRSNIIKSLLVIAASTVCYVNWSVSLKMKFTIQCP